MAASAPALAPARSSGARGFAKTALAAGFYLAGLLPFVRRRGVPILCYHSVDDSGSLISTSTSEFAEQMALLDRWGYRTMRLGALCELLRAGHPLPRRHVVLTFDDGYRNNHEQVTPILERYGFSATVFIVTGSLGGGIDWTKTDDIPDLELMSWEEARAMVDCGWEVEGHSISHPNLRKLGRDAVRHELGRSKQEMEQRLGRDVSLLAYPYGEYDAEIVAVAEELGYVGAVTVEMGLAEPGDAPLTLRRMSVNAMAGVDRATRMLFFKACVLGTASWYIGLQRWLPGLVNPQRPWEDDPDQKSGDAAETPGPAAQ